MTAVVGLLIAIAAAGYYAIEWMSKFILFQLDRPRIRAVIHHSVFSEKRWQGSTRALHILTFRKSVNLRVVPWVGLEIDSHVKVSRVVLQTVGEVDVEVWTEDSTSSDVEMSEASMLSQGWELRGKNTEPHPRLEEVRAKHRSDTDLADATPPSTV